VGGFSYRKLHILGHSELPQSAGLGNLKSCGASNASEGFGCLTKNGIAVSTVGVYQILLHFNPIQLSITSKALHGIAGWRD